MEFADLKRRVVELYEMWHPDAVLVEDAASGQSLIQELRAETTLPLKPIKPDRDKYSHVAAVCLVLEARRLILPEVAWWRDDFIAELTAFPAGAHDDWVDARRAGAQLPPRVQRAGHHHLLPLGDALRARRAGRFRRGNC